MTQPIDRETAIALAKEAGMAGMLTDVVCSLEEIHRLCNLAIAHSRKDAEPVGWKCFHCGEVFTTKLEGLKHFGSSERQDPACTIDVLQYRAMEALIERYVDEDTDLHRSMGKMRSDHETALRREEEAGYARGLADGQKLCVKESCYSPTPARQEDQRDTHPPEADKLLQQALDFVAFEKDGSTQSVEAFINSRDSLITAIRTYLENKT